MTRIGGFVPKGPARFLQGSGFGYPGSWAVLIREPQIRILEPLGSDVAGFSPPFLPQQEIELGPSRSPMEIILGRLWARTSAPDILAMRRNLHKFITAIEGNLKVGTACSGSDVVLPTVNNALALWRQEFGFQVSFEHAYSCESVEFKQRWILKHFGKKRHAVSRSRALVGRCDGEYPRPDGAHQAPTFLHLRYRVRLGVGIKHPSRRESCIRLSPSRPCLQIVRSLAPHGRALQSD